MAVAKWTWDATNPSSSQTGSIYALSGATTDETKRSYQTLAEKGAVSNFSYKVWNDMCLKLKDLSTEWGVENELNDVWVNSPHQSDYPDETTFKKSDGGIIKANAMNQVSESFPNFVQKPFSGQFKKGDPCKAEYFLSFAEKLNHWCTLSTAELHILLNMVLSGNCNSIAGKVATIVMNEQIQFLIRMNIGMLNVAALSFLLKMSFSSKGNADTGKQRGILPSTNDFHFETICTAFNKNIAYANLTKNDFLWIGKMTARVGNLVSVKIDDNFHYTISNIQVITGSAKYTQISAKFNLSINMSLRTERPVVAKGRGEYRHDGWATFDFQDGTGLETVDGTIAFSDNFNNGDVIGKALAHDGSLAIVSPYIDMQETIEKALELEDKIIVSGDIGTISNSVGNLELTDQLAFSGNQEIDTQSPELFESESDFSIIDGEIEISFANDKELETEDGKITIVDSGIELSMQSPVQIEHDGSIQFKDEMLLEESNFKMISSEVVIPVSYQAGLSTRKIAEQSATVIATVITQAEIGNASRQNIESEVISDFVQNAVLDMIYTKGNVLSGDLIAEIISAAETAFINQKRVEADSQAQIDFDATISEKPTEGMDGDQIASSSSEATIALARVQLALEEIYDDRLESDLDDISEEELERTLIFE